MTNESADLFIQQENQRQDFIENSWDFIELEASRLEITCDYYIAEFL